MRPVCLLLTGLALLKWVNAVSPGMWPEDAVDTPLEVIGKPRESVRNTAGEMGIKPGCT